MKLKHFLTVFLALLALLSLNHQPAQATAEDAALFYEELSQYGNWVDYQDYGPVWYPTKVEEGWRPYVNGRFTPSEQGWVFETDEPFGWAVYHYGNWMPSEEYGWLWVPGRTWYPNTVAWRSSDDYIGWACIPPPKYKPATSIYMPGEELPPDSVEGGFQPGPTPGVTPQPTPEDLGGLTPEPTGPAYPPPAPPGDYGVAPLPPEEQICDACWTFSSSAGFVRGYNQPYTPAVSYVNCGCLAPPVYTPVCVAQTAIVPNYVACDACYAPAAIAVGVGLAIAGIYAFGPPFGFINHCCMGGYGGGVTINTWVRNVHIHRCHNCWPPPRVLRDHPHIAKTLPGKHPGGKDWDKKPPKKVDHKIAKGNLGKPDAIKKPEGVKPIPPGKIGKATKKGDPAAPGAKGKGLGLPGKSAQPLSPKMKDQAKAQIAKAAKAKAAPPKAAPPKAAPPKAAPPKAAPPKAAPPKAAPPKAAPPKAAPPKAAPPKAAPPKAAPPKAAPPKAAPPKAAPPKAAPPKAAPPKAAPPKPKAAPPKAAPPKAAPPKAAPPKAAPPKAAPPRPKAAPPKAAPPRPKAAPPKAAPPRPAPPPKAAPPPAPHKKKQQ
jgi:hypothetical protein